MGVTVKRVYEHPEPADGYRILVDRVWPRGVSKEHAAVELWLKEVGPSTELRKWFGHDPERYDEFAERYRAELANSDAMRELTDAVSQHDTVTLVYSAKDEQHNQAVVLQQLLS
ncbi:uncharacterized protein YeaO (DUF488 family) [Homoserinimonas aerilata]|uniref:Uncharacterized protein YeaO (DUF488 family) n=1 Tax=Homoserinimonas aerilata TaxID=1162970 RepID=A0A542YGC2_9MICO|nr:DUF488 domain-containing protein [Homoserinimonas aerilata]TQL47125.1 uncharacterized protein YeaO (DUF488 family) [Homoserinimonas aerilata]